MNIEPTATLERPGTISRYLYLVLGGFLVAVGVVGIFLPVLPTTIFLLLASACFMKSSPRVHQWLINHKYLGTYIKNYREKTGLTVRAKVSGILMLWLSLAFSALFFTESLAIRALLLIIGVGVTLHLVSIKTAQPESGVHSHKNKNQKNR